MLTAEVLTAEVEMEEVEMGKLLTVGQHPVKVVMVVEVDRVVITIVMPSPVIIVSPHYHPFHPVLRPPPTNLKVATTASVGV